MAGLTQEAQNFQALTKKSFDIHFDLKHTNYDPVENIGTGAYGVVCSAVNRLTKEKVAIKKIPQIFEREVIALRTYREMKILRHFKHDNVIAIRDIIMPKSGQLDDVYIVLDLMESDLHRIIHSQQPLTEEHVRYFLYQILRGLKYIHSANVVHRDLKPSNLLVNENCELKIGDFGMARCISGQMVEENLKITQYVATRWYRAPEIMLLPTTYTAAVDMWSVGCILAEMVGRRHIFPGTSSTHQLKLIFGILGTPAPDFLSQATDAIRRYIQAFGFKAPEKFDRLYPKASSNIIHLLQSILKVDPRHRMTVEEALRHPFLAKYHNLDDEPICIHTLNYDLDNLMLNREEIREAVMGEIDSFHQSHKPKLNTFNFKVVPKSELEKSKAKHAGKMSPAAREDKSNILKELCEKAIESKVAGAAIKVDSSNNKSSEDVVMLSANSMNKPRAAPDLLAVAAGDKSAPDVVMLGAKKEEVIKADPEEAKVESTVTSSGMASMCTKAKIKAALCSKQRMKNENSDLRPKPITAIQRQREREERRRKKKERAEERKKKKGIKVKSSKADQGVSLTDADKSLLERWKKLAQPATQSKAQAPNAQTGQVLSTQNSQVPHSSTETSLSDPSGLIGGQSTIDQATTDSNRITLNEEITSAAPFMAFQHVGDVACGTPSQGNSTQPAFFPSTNIPFASYDSSMQPPTATYMPIISTGSISQSTAVSVMTNNATHLSLAPCENPILAPPTGPTYINQIPATLPGSSLATQTVLPSSLPDQIPGNITTCVPDIMPCTANMAGTSQSGVFEAASLISSTSTTSAISGIPQSIISHYDVTDSKPSMQNPVVASTSRNDPDLVIITKQMMRSRMEDLTLQKTPKGTGNGYGVGLDMELLDSFTMESRPDSAPLSASLIKDWLEVTADADIPDMETLQLEFDLASPLDFNSLT